MNYRVLSTSLVLFCTLQFAFPIRISAAETPAEIVITVDGMHCDGCAKKLAKRLKVVKNVASATVDVKTGKATVISTKTKSASAKVLWEAVEGADFTPTKLIGPDGTFTTKPKS